MRQTANKFNSVKRSQQLITAKLGESELEYSDIVNNSTHTNPNEKHMLHIENSSIDSKIPKPQEIRPSNHAYLVQQQLLRKDSFAEKYKLIPKGDILIPSQIESLE